MLKAINIYNQKKFYTWFHGWIYYLSKIPFVGKIFNKAHGLARKIDFIILPISAIVFFITSFLGKALYLFIMMIWVGIILNLFGSVGSLKNPDILIFLFTGVIFSGVFRHFAYFYINDADSYTFIKVMKMKAREYFLSQFFYTSLVHIITFSIMFILIYTISSLPGLNIRFDINPFGVFGLITLVTSLRLPLAWIGLKLDFKENNYSIGIYISYILMTLVILSTVICIILDATIDLRFLYDWKLGFVGLAIFALFSYLIIKTKNIEKISARILKAKDFDTSEIDAEFLSGAKVKSEDLSIESVDTSKYQGIVYINKIFFKRYRKALIKKTLVGNIIKFILFVGLLIAQIVYLPRLNMTITEEAEFINDIKTFLPYVTFGISYLAFNGSFFIKFLYHNMDKKLMRYSYYRTGDSIFKSIKIRVFELIKLHLPAFILLMANIIVFTRYINMDFYDTARALFFAILGMVFFSFFNLYIYYIIQPFTSDGNIKHPLISAIPWALYMGLSYASGSKYSDLILNIIGLACLLFLIIGAVLIYKLAPKRFKVR